MVKFDFFISISITVLWLSPFIMLPGPSHLTMKMALTTALIMSTTLFEVAYASLYGESNLNHTCQLRKMVFCKRSQCLLNKLQKLHIYLVLRMPTQMSQILAVLKHMADSS